QQRALSGPVSSNHTNNFTGLNLERDIVERPNKTISVSPEGILTTKVCGPVAISSFQGFAEVSKRRLQTIRNHVTQRLVSLVLTNTVPFAKAVDLYCKVIHD